MQNKISHLVGMVRSTTISDLVSSLKSNFKSVGFRILLSALAVGSITYILRTQTILCKIKKIIPDRIKNLISSKKESEENINIITSTSLGLESSNASGKSTKSNSLGSTVSEFEESNFEEDGKKGKDLQGSDELKLNSELLKSGMPTGAKLSRENSSDVTVKESKGEGDAIDGEGLDKTNTKPVKLTSEESELTTEQILQKEAEDIRESIGCDTRDVLRIKDKSYAALQKRISTLPDKDELTNILEKNIKIGNKGGIFFPGENAISAFSKVLISSGLCNHEFSGSKVKDMLYITSDNELFNEVKGMGSMSPVVKHGSIINRAKFIEFVKEKVASKYNENAKYACFILTEGGVDDIERSLSSQGLDLKSVENTIIGSMDLRVYIGFPEGALDGHPWVEGNPVK